MQRAFDAMNTAIALRALRAMVSDVHLKIPGIDYAAHARDFIWRFEAVMVGSSAAWEPRNVRSSLRHGAVVPLFGLTQFRRISTATIFRVAEPIHQGVGIKQKALPREPSIRIDAQIE
jgi:hypothetical protein